jgi:hypothetical protein
MIKKILFCSLSVLAIICTHAQEFPVRLNNDTMSITGQPPVLSEEELMSLLSMPPLPVPDLYKGPNAPELPYSLNNSQHSFFRPVFNQAGYSCGQATMVSYNFTYEVNRLRNLQANIPDNQYPTHFAWNWINGGNGWYGGSYFHTTELLKHVGTPSVSTYGGMSEGGSTRWMSGYDNYYQAMHNRIYDAFLIDVSTIEGLNILKHYLHDHLEGSPFGGVASFYANQPALYTLPAGTPEAGKKVVISWANSSHAMTIVGYNDSIRWDYNNDGQYTNHLDINGDGIVDLRDWEIGGLLMVNSYGGVPGWGDGGFAYMMYKSLAEPFGAGGIWNNTVNVIKPKENTEPQLTMKVTLKHNSRNKIKVTAGLSPDPNATLPTIEMDFPIFDFQGDHLYMQGGTGEADKTIEFGLDITPLLSHLPSGQNARFFLKVNEKDPGNAGSGEILFFSLRDYTNGLNEIVCTDAPIPIIENGLTTIWVNASVNYSAVNITTENIPDAKFYEPYSFQLEANGGAEPYHWYMKYDYTENDFSQPFPAVSAQQLTPTNNTSGYATGVLDFEFPFYGELYDTVFLHVNGIMLFDRQNYPWPYFGEPMIMFRGYRGISAFNRDLRLYGGQGIWYEGDENSATFRWKASVNGNQSSEMNFAIKLYPNGDIDYYYNDMNYPSNTEWIGGISKGDYRNFQLLELSGTASIANNHKVEMLAPDFVYEMELLPSGVFQGTPTRVYDNQMLKFMAVDNNSLFTTKTLPFSTRGFKIDYEVQSGSNNIIGYGETALMDVILKSMEPDTVTNAVMQLFIDDPYITLVDSLYQITAIAPGDSVVFESAFIFDISNQVPNNHPLPFELTITSADDSWSRQIPLTAFAPVVGPSYIVIQDGNNGILDPGETTDILIFFKNNGGASVNNLSILIQNDDPDLTINSDSAFISTIAAGSGQFAQFNITASDQLETGQLLTIETIINGNNDYSNTGLISIVTGILVENFESGSFNTFPWQFSGSQPWIIEGSQVYEGQYSARSGAVSHNQLSEMYMDIVVTADDSISFYRKVSSEHNYDFLKFFINNNPVGQWSGEVPWENVSFPVSAGQHTLKWAYIKDQTVSNGTDCAWVDYILLPPMLTASAGEDTQVCENEPAILSGSASNYSALLWNSSGTGTFSDNTILNPIYTPSDQDIIDGSVILSLSAEHLMYSVSDSIVLSIGTMPSVSAGPDDQTCEGLNFIVSQASASDYLTLLWVSSGTGTFNNPAVLNPVYTPSAFDISQGSIVLSLTAFAQAPCSNATDSLILTISQQPEAFAGNDNHACVGEGYLISDATATNFDEVFWTSSGSGTFDNITLVNPTYTPSTVDLEAGVVILTMNVSGIAPCGNTTDQVNLSIYDIPEPPFMPAGPDSVNLALSDSSLYVINPSQYGFVYDWVLNPEESGTINSGDTVAVVYWNEGFAGDAQISVKAVNNCGESGYSEIKHTWVYTSSVGIAGIVTIPSIQVAPNPSDGIFELFISNAFHDPFVISVYNLIGNEIYYLELEKSHTGNVELNLQHLPQGMYVLVIRSNRFTLNQKLMIRR